MKPLVAVAFTLLLVGSASAQTASVPKATVDLARSSWRKLSQSEVDCVDKALRVRGSQIWQLIERGVGSGDASVARVRAGCRTEPKPSVARTAVESSTHSGAAQATRAVPVLAAQAPRPPGPIVERATAMAAGDRATIAATGAEDTAEFIIPLNKTPVERANIQPMPLKIVTAPLSESKLAVNEAVAEKASAETAVRIARADAERAKAEADQARYEAERATADAIVTLASAKWEVGFIRGLISGPAVLIVGGLVFLLLRRRKQARAVSDDVSELDQDDALRQA